MKRVLKFVLGMALCLAPSSYAEVVVFSDGTEIKVETYEVRGSLFVFTTTEGRVRSVALSFVNLEATEQSNGLAGAAASAKTHPTEGGPAKARPPEIRPPGARPPEAPRGGSPTPARNERPTGELSPKVEKLLESLGLKSIIFQMPAVVSAAVAQAEKYVSGDGPEVAGIVLGAFEHAFQPDEIYGVVSSSFADRAEDSQLNSAMLWLRSPLARRMSDLELSARTPEGLRLLREYAASLESTMPSAARLDMLQRLDEVTGRTEADVERRIRILRTVIESFNHLVPSEHHMTEEEIEQTVEKVRSELHVSMKNYSLVNLLFTYRSASDADLGKYITFWETVEGQWLKRATEESLSAGMFHGFETAIERVAQEVKAGGRQR